jgi:hypothetical protein
MDLNRKCKYCFVDLTSSNTYTMGYRNGVLRYQYKCKKCNIGKVKEFFINNPRPYGYAKEYAHSVGRVKQYNCETCDSLCYKKYAKAFCSDLCRFISYVEIKEDCWLWFGPVNKKGYGKFCFRGNKTDSSHRVSYKLFNGSIESDGLVCHSCDIPACVNPDHLWIGTHKQNMLDMVVKERQYSKLKPTEVFKIRKLWESGYTQKKIMELFEISSSQISNIVSRRIWKSV